MKILDAERASKRDDRDKSLWFINRKKLLSSLLYQRSNSLFLCAEIPLSPKPPGVRDAQGSQLRASDSPAQLFHYSSSWSGALIISARAKKPRCTENG
jgi:hypothetical protein